MIDLTNPETLEAYKLGINDGENNILVGLGIRRTLYEDLLKLKVEGSAVSISFTSHKLPYPEFVDQEFSDAPLGEAFVEKALDLVNRIEDKTND